MATVVTTTPEAAPVGAALSTTSGLLAATEGYKHAINEYSAYEAGVLLNNRYLKLANIQAGSYGQVSLARDVQKERDVAVKAMDKSVKGVSIMARHEISVIRRVGYHQNICQLLDFFETKSHYFLVFEYCEHGDLYDFLKSQASKDSKKLHGFQSHSSPILFKQFVKELCAAVEHSHRRGVYHRDIKPENILIASNGSIKLTDWGLATLSCQAADPCIGTEKYMAPETFFKKSSKPLVTYDSAKADYWSLGITLLYTLFGRCPFKLANVSADTNFKKFVDSSYHLFNMYPNLSKHGFHAIMQLLQLNPIHRSMDKCLEVLNESYGSGLTLEQEMDQYVNYNGSELFEDDSNNMMFGLDDELEPLESQHNVDEETTEEYNTLNDGAQQSTTSNEDLEVELSGTMPPPSLTCSLFGTSSSYPMGGTSWAEMHDELDDHFSFQIQRIGSLLEKQTRH